MRRRSDVDRRAAEVAIDAPNDGRRAEPRSVVDGACSMVALRPDARDDGFG